MARFILEEDVDIEGPDEEDAPPLLITRRASAETVHILAHGKANISARSWAPELPALVQLHIVRSRP